MTKIYQRVNEAAREYRAAACLREGAIEVWYSAVDANLPLWSALRYLQVTDGRVEQDSLDRATSLGFDPSDLAKTHRLLGKVAGDPPQSPDAIWVALQGEVWSPMGEARALISTYGLQHTSMDVSDVVVIDGVVLMCASSGWLILGVRVGEAFVPNRRVISGRHADQRDAILVSAGREGSP